jgi:transposase-like protein
MIMLLISEGKLGMYAKGMNTRDIVETFAELYGTDISPALVSQVTDSILEKDIEWQTRPLDTLYPIVYLGCIVVKIRQDNRVINKAVYVALGVNVHGTKSCWACGCLKTRGPSSGCPCRPN